MCDSVQYACLCVSAYVWPEQVQGSSKTLLEGTTTTQQRKMGSHGSETAAGAAQDPYQLSPNVVVVPMHDPQHILLTQQSAVRHN